MTNHLVLASRQSIVPWAQLSHQLPALVLLLEVRLGLEIRKPVTCVHEREMSVDRTKSLQIQLK